MNRCIPQALASPSFSNSSAMLIMLMDQGRLTAASLQTHTTASHRMNKNREWISLCFLYLQLSFRTTLIFQKAEQPPLFTMLQHTALPAFLLQMRWEWFLDKNQSLWFLTFPPIKAQVVVKRTIWNCFLKTHHEKVVAGRLATSPINTCIFSTLPLLHGSQA